MIPEEKIRDLLTASNLKLCTAESCTGGLVAHRITNVSGSSAYFPGGVVSYSNEIKTKLLGVPLHILEKNGAVSEETVLAMAKGAKGLFNAEIAVSVSGIAGPTGGTPEKPVGLTWIAISTPDGEWTRHFIWNGNRKQNKQDSAEQALQFVVDYLEDRLRRSE